MAARAAMSIDRFGEYAASTAPAPETVSSLKAKVARLLKRISILESELQTARTQRDLAAAVEQDDTALNREQRQRQQEAARNRELSAKLEAANKSLADSSAAQQRAELAVESVGKLREQLVREERAREQAESDARRLRDELLSYQKQTCEADAIVQLRSALAAEKAQTEKLRERELKLQRELATMAARAAKGMDTLQLTRDAQSRRREEEKSSMELRAKDAVRGQVEAEVLRGELWGAEIGLQQAQAAAEALGSKAEELITRLIEQQDQSRWLKSVCGKMQSQGTAVFVCVGQSSLLRMRDRRGCGEPIRRWT
eukprot:6205789-Pleurochrysis_carterae.AAC.6